MTEKVIEQDLSPWYTYSAVTEDRAMVRTNSYVGTTEVCGIASRLYSFRFRNTIGPKTQYMSIVKRKTSGSGSEPQRSTSHILDDRPLCQLVTANSVFS